MNRFSVLPLTMAASLLASAALAQGEHKMDHQGHKMEMTDKCALPMGEGVINALDVKNAKLNLTHKPIEALDWDEMTMDFSVEKIVDLAAFYEEEKVHFMLKPAKDGAWSVAMMCSLEIDAGAHTACMKAMSEEQARITAEADADCAGAAPDAGAHHGHH
ncbi:copper-binding protein [Marinicaulis aureus]|uniref:Copper-binding protein n=1 Tax=Hyphococcus aureus TaxID=2666033 RepID=A0ABW1KYF1_9PROT